MGLETIAIAGLVVSAVGTLGGIASSIVGMRQQKKAQKAAEQQAALQRNQERRRMIREQRIRRAQSLNAAAQIGATQEGSSGIAGGLTSLNSQTGSNLGFATQMQGLSDIQSKASLGASKAGAIGSIFGSAANLGFSAFSAAGGFKSLSGGGNPTAPSLFPQEIPSGIRNFGQ